MQEILTEMVRLQTGRAEVDDFVAQKAAMLTDMAKDAGDDLQKIVEGASEGMEAANARVRELTAPVVSRGSRRHTWNGSMGAYADVP